MKRCTADHLLAMLNFKESRAIKTAQTKYLRNRRNNIYVALEDVEDADFIWSDEEVQEFGEMWNEEYPLTRIAEELDKTETAVFLLAVDRLFRGMLEPRSGWKIW